MQTMVGPATESEPQSQATIQQPLSAEEEALKRNTDCVYFLASPLTCKKGSECEYRHSDVARVNPRDCWYWLNANCLNPKCGFRHPPLDGLLGTQVPLSSGSSQTAGPPVPHVPNASGKQGVPCVFFQQGFCMKGHWCPFSHGSNSLNNKPLPQAPGATSAFEPATVKKSHGAFETSTREKKAPAVNAAKLVKLPPQAISAARLESAPVRNEFSISKKMQQTSGTGNETLTYRTSAPAANGKTVSNSKLVHQPQTFDELGKDAEEISREPSPGFDVLVDDELRDSDYYPGEDQYGIARDHEERNEYDRIADLDSDRYREHHGYDSYESIQGQYAWEQRRASSERRSADSAYLERRRYENSTERVDASDLRHRLSKHRKPNGLRSVISNDYARERNFDDRLYNGPRGDLQQLSRHESSLSTRLQGRIKLPGRSSSPVEGKDLRNDRERSRGGTDRGTVRAYPSSHQGRLRDRIKGRAEEHWSNDGRNNNRGMPLRRDILDDSNTGFAGPKSLAELKTGRSSEPSGQQSLGKRKHVMPDGQQTGDDLSFEGPKPLEEILKRKKGEGAGSGSGRTLAHDEGNGQRKAKENASVLAESRHNISSTVGNNNDFHMSASANKMVAEESGSTHGQSSLQPDFSDRQVEDERVIEDGIDQKPDADEQKDGDSDYEQMDGDYYDLDEGGENGDSGEYPDDDDGDDFAKKMGVMYS